MRAFLSGNARTVIVAVVAAMVASVATAGAASLITGKQIKDGSVTAKDLSKALQRQLAKTGAAGAAGPRGPAGVPGPAGAQGPPGVSGLVVVSGSSGDQDSDSGKAATATCPAGKRVIGASGEIRGGVSGSSPDELSHVVIDEVVPTTEDVVPGSVTARAYEEEPTAATWALRAYAICANVS